MSTKYRFIKDRFPHFITLTLVEWIDLFSRERYKEIIIKNLDYCIKEKGLIIHCYVIMSNHLHLIVNVSNETDLSSLIRNFKRYTAKVLYETLKSDSRESRRNWLLWIMESQGKKSSSNTNYKVWRHENHPVVLDSNFILEQKVNYIHENPVRAGICFTKADYKYSSAGQYAGEIGLLDIEFIE